jgi:hypothetical protein
VVQCDCKARISIVNVPVPCSFKASSGDTTNVEPGVYAGTVGREVHSCPFKPHEDPHLIIPIGRDGIPMFR